MAFACTTPAIPTVQRDDDDVRITRWDFVPGAVTGWHNHGLPYFIVMLTDSTMRVDDGKNITDYQRKVGESYSRASGVEHDVMNASDTPMAFVEIEVKRIEALIF